MPKKDFSWGSVSYEGDIDVMQTPANRTAAMKDQDDFKFIRMIANLTLTKPNSTGPLTPAATVLINVTQADINTAGGIDNLKVAYWRGNWKPLTVTSRGQNSVAVHYDKNGDPPVAVGS